MRENQFWEDNKMKVFLSIFEQMICDLINRILISTIDIIPIKFSDTLQRTMRIPKSYLPSHSRLLLFSAIIAVASTLSAFKIDITPQDARNQIDTAKQFLNGCRNASNPSYSCLPCLLEISAEIDKNGQAMSVDKNQTLRKIRQSQEELRNRLESADAASQKGLCGILQLKAGILRHNIIVLNKTIKEKDSAIKKLTERAELAENNYEKCRNQRPEDISCPPCPKPLPCDCPTCTQITCPICKEPTVCPTCTERDCSACQTQRQDLKQKLAICQAQLKTANATIKTSTNAQAQAVASINASISQARKQITEKLTAKNNGKLNSTKLITILTDIEQKAKSNSTIQNQIKQYESLVSELIYFIDAATTIAAQERASKEKLLQNFKKAVGELKQCNDYLHGKGVKNK